MKKVPDPSYGPRNRDGVPEIWVSESHEEHLLTTYPSLRPELERLQDAQVPASFKTKPGHVTGRKLFQLGVPGICPKCFEYADVPNPKCRKHPKTSGGGVTTGSSRHDPRQPGTGVGAGHRAG